MSSSRIFQLYLSRAAQANVAYGERAGIWGLTTEAVQRRLEVVHDMQHDGVEILRSMQPGDHVLAAYGGPQPRVPRGGWRDQRLQGGILWRVSSPYVYDETEVWPAPDRKPDERWPHRFGIERVDVLTEVTKRDVGLLGMDALHYSANTGGMPVPLEMSPDLVTRTAELEPGETDDPVFLALDGDLDGTAWVRTRREQRKLRKLLFGDGRMAECALCAATLPVDCIRTAHVKKRSRCTDHELRQLPNVMPACMLGCDHLFELGYVYVDADGAIKRNRRRDADVTPALVRAIELIEDRPCTAHSRESEPYFAWHREQVAV